jgi:hypothetical protein
MALSSAKPQLYSRRKMMKTSAGFVAALLLTWQCIACRRPTWGGRKQPDGSPGWNSGVPAQPAIEPVPQMLNTPPTAANAPLSNCDSAGCWAADGTRYTRAGNTLFGSDGKICNIVAPGAPAMCN